MHAMQLRRAINPRLAAQAVTIKVSANLVVQTVALRNDPLKTSVDWQQVIEFALYGLLGSQIGNMFQFFLEDWFPNQATSLPEKTDDIQLTQLGDTKPQQEPPEADPAVDGNLAWQPKRRMRWVKWTAKDLNWRNLAAKLFVDQTLGLVISGSIFLTCTNIARVSSIGELFAVYQARLFPLITAGWHIWPLIALANFLWVPLRSRVLVAVIVGFGWSIFLSIFANHK